MAAIYRFIAIMALQQQLLFLLVVLCLITVDGGAIGGVVPGQYLETW